jgi:hypothetical protein
MRLSSKARVLPLLVPRTALRSAVRTFIGPLVAESIENYSIEDGPSRGGRVNRCFGVSVAARKIVSTELS